MSARPLTVLLLGGYGTFGSRLARRLADTPDLTLIVAGRSADAAARFCAGLPHRAVLKPAKLDRDGDLTSDVRALRPDILVDATGPFQRHGPRPYRVVETCLALGVHYLDLADGSDFVQGISTFNDLAQAKSLVVLAGLSTFPAFSGAVVADLARGLSRVDRITMGVAPSPFVGIGLSVVRAVASYAGKPVRLRRDGRETTGVGLVETRRLTVSPPGRLPLQSRIFSLVDVPDLRLVPDRRPGLDAIWVGVGTLPAAFHWGLRQMARLVRFGLLPSLGPFAALFWRVINRVGWGERRGGFVVVVEGQDAGGGPVMRSWHLIADEDDGPFIPCLAAEAVLLSALAGRWPAPGARPASDAVRLEDLEPLIASLRISSGHRTSSPEQAGQPLYRRILGERWTELPPAVRALHDSNATTNASRDRPMSIEVAACWPASSLACSVSRPRAPRFRSRSSSRCGTARRSGAGPLRAGASAPCSLKAGAASSISSSNGSAPSRSGWRP